MTDLKAFLTGTKATDAEQKTYLEQLDQINQDLIAALPHIRQQFTAIEKGDDVELETRQINLAVPKLYWDTFEKVVKVFQLREEFQIKNTEDVLDQIQDTVIEGYRAKTDLILSEILLSQFMLDTVIGFAVYVTQTQLASTIQNALKNNDPEVLLQVLDGLQRRSLNEPDDSDDDTEN